MGTLVAAFAQLDTKVPQAQRGKPGAVARVHHHLRDRIARKVVAGDFPQAALATHHQQAFAAGDQQGLHVLVSFGLC